ncbi:hypothetical protein DL96DRAFT_1586750 [Flagelloscypha sp. PMI_526]|nr:hypothetical protein DL96DRAFT_1586750 [Flagelloscypha sp. PMI_526]
MATKRAYALVTPDSSPEGPPRKRKSTGTPFPESARSSDAFKEPELPVFKGIPFPSLELESDSSSLPRTPVHNRIFPSSDLSSSIPRPYPLAPVDSPNNPFGRKISLSMTQGLPSATSVKKHVRLRFQFICSPRARPQAGIHRIVRVPRNYTFTHLRELVSFLFGDICEPATNRNRKGRIFQVFDNTEVWTEPRVGEIKRGNPWINLSSDRNPYLFHPELVDQDEDEEDLSEWLEEQKKRFEIVDGDDARWEEEETFTIAHVFPPEKRRRRGIRYFPVCGASSQFHITEYTGDSFPLGSSKTNEPMVYEAHGRVRPWPFTGVADILDSDGEEEPYDAVYDETERCPLDTDEWNVSQSFGTFYRGAVPAILLSPSSNRVMSHPPSTPDLTFSSSSSSQASSSFDFSSPLASTSYRSSAFPSPTSISKATPAPSKANLFRLNNMRNRLISSKSATKAPKYDLDSKDPDDRPPDEQELIIDQLVEGTPLPQTKDQEKGGKTGSGVFKRPTLIKDGGAEKRAEVKVKNPFGDSRLGIGLDIGESGARTPEKKRQRRGFIDRPASEEC